MNKKIEISVAQKPLTIKKNPKLLEKQNSIHAETNKLTEGMRKENFSKAGTLFIEGNLARKEMELAQKNGDKPQALTSFTKARNSYTEAIKLYPDPRITSNLISLLIQAGHDIDARIMLEENKESLLPEMRTKLNEVLSKKQQ